MQIWAHQILLSYHHRPRKVGNNAVCIGAGAGAAKLEAVDNPFGHEAADNGVMVVENTAEVVVIRESTQIAEVGAQVERNMVISGVVVDSGAEAPNTTAVVAHNTAESADQLNDIKMLGNRLYSKVEAIAVSLEAADQVDEVEGDCAYPEV
ncbi:hypothetical protein NKR19_g7641 [Coniochaeta hoffmannii]|uniref:Uncharacterized protein n=1 Tax=Coniochaeta hoffmannii TaxID=91930 RepID=A0AA38RG17_9PEZI|nr:hypothetical protein NKR19_g7641 [Coniochaeta hoffmannii]